MQPRPVGGPPFTPVPAPASMGPRPMGMPGAVMQPPATARPPGVLMPQPGGFLPGTQPPRTFGAPTGPFVPRGMPGSGPMPGGEAQLAPRGPLPLVQPPPGSVIAPRGMPVPIPGILPLPGRPVGVASTPAPVSGPPSAVPTPMAGAPPLTQPVRPIVGTPGPVGHPAALSSAGPPVASAHPPPITLSQPPTGPLAHARPHHPPIVAATGTWSVAPPTSAAAAATTQPLPPAVAPPPLFNPSAIPGNKPVGFGPPPGRLTTAPSTSTPPVGGTNSLVSPPSSSAANPPTAMSAPAADAAPSSLSNSGLMSPTAFSGGLIGTMAPERKAAAPQSRIDPSGIPRPRYNLETEPFMYNTKEIGASSGATLPPPAHSFFVVTDGGNCNPRFMRSSMYQLPATSALLSDVKVPMAVIVNPLAELGERDTPVSVVDFGEEGPIRCGRCKAYVNAFCRFRDGGAAYTCPFCTMVNQVPRTYQCGLDQYGRRRDFFERPELRFGSCDFAVPAAYNVRTTPQIPTFVFIVDVSFHAVANGALQACVDAISDALEDLPEDASTRVGLITFDDAIHYYDIKGEIAGMTAVVDVDDPFCPLPDSNWLPPLETSRPTLLDLLKRLPVLFGGSRVLQSSMGAAVKSAVLGLQDIGGRITLFHSHLPTIGEGKLTNRENIRAYGAADTEKPMYLPDEKSAKFYADLATSAAGRQIGIDVFACGSQFCDLATTGVLANTTGGEIRRVPGFKRPTSNTVSIAASGGPPVSTSNGVQAAMLHEESLDKHAQEEVARSQSEAADSLCTQFWALFHRNYGFEAVMKVRCSQGLRVGEYIGAYCNRTGSDADLALIDSDKAVAVTLVHDGSGLKPGTEAYIQCALLYTTPHRQRRVRVHTLCLVAASDLAAVFKNADYEVVLNLIIRRHVQALRDHDLSWVEGEMLRECVEMLFSYRKNCSSTASAGQLVLPESLKVLPLLLSATLKLDAFGMNKKPNLSRTNVFDHIDIRADARVASFNRLITLPLHITLQTVYSRLFSLHDMGPDAGKPAYQLDASGNVSTERSTTPVDPGVKSRSLSRAQAGSRCGRGSRVSLRARSVLSSGSMTPGEYLVIPVNLPILRWPSVDHLFAGGMFILEGDGGIFVRIGEDPNPDQLASLFGEREIAKLPALPVLTRQDTDFSRRLWAIIDYLQSLHEVHRPVYVVTPYGPDWLKGKFFNMLVEDTNRGGKSYVDFLCSVHTAIQAKLVE